MQTVHGGATSTPSSTSSNVTAPSAIPKHTRYSSSRSNSFSSASIVTVKRTASLSSSSGTGARNSAAPISAQSPGDTSLIALRVSREQLSQDQKRRKSVAIDSTERPNSDVLSSSHRHSHSTSSSVTSGSNTRRNRSSSGALVGGLPGQGFSPKKRGAGTIDYSPRSSLQKTSLSRPSSRTQRSPATSPERERRRPSRPELTNPLNNLPSLQTAPGLINDTESPSTIQTITTPSTQTSYNPDYFLQDSVSPQYTSKDPRADMIRSQTAPVPAVDPLRGQAVAGAQDADAVNTQPTRNEEGKTNAPQNEELQQPQSSSKSAGKEGSRSKTRTRERGEKDKKNMLARALQKANEAVLLDNAQNFEGALGSYLEACHLLQQVTERSTGIDDKRKLNAIKYTYTTRIEELRQIGVFLPEFPNEKALPAGPTVDTTINPALASTTAASTGLSKPSQAQSAVDSFGPTAMRGIAGSADEESLPSEPVFDVEGTPWTPPSEAPPTKTSVLHISPPRNDKYIPAPLSPKRAFSPQPKNEPREARSEDPRLLMPFKEKETPQEDNESNAPLSPLDTIEEDSSRTSSVHSISPQQGVRRKYLRGVSGISSNADFDAAFDAAVEAAYDQGLEPDTEGINSQDEVRKKHETNESIPVRSSEIAEITSPQVRSRLYQESNLEADDDEDRMFDDIAQDYAQAFDFDISSKSALPRESGSSGYSRSTWQSSQLSDRATAGTSLSTVAEDALPHPTSKNAFVVSPSLNNSLAEPAPPPPLTAPPPQTSLPKIPNAIQSRTPSVLNRRLSGQNMKQLKIDTPGPPDARKRMPAARSTSPAKANEERLSELSKEFDFGTSLQPITASDMSHDDSLNSTPSLNLPSASAVSDGSRPMTATTSELRQSDDEDPSELRTHKPTFFKKDKSSDGLREHMVLLASPTVETAPTLYTPLSSTFMNFSSKRMNETPLTSQRANLPSFGGTAVSRSYQGVVLFDTSLSDGPGPSSPKSPSIPTGVEPCPESFLLRPFWLMRNLASTLTHPKGGFLTSRLFVPRDVWQIQSMKLKNLEDKIANCDLLTAALGRLAGVDTYDADAVMEELESFEDVLERVQNTLAKKLGSEVGTGGLNSLFKDACSSTTAATTASLAPDGGSEKVKGYLSSWRKLRQKSSGAPVAGAPMNKNSSKAEKEALNMSTVPMTGFVSLDRRGNRKEARSTAFEGPNKDYMSSLARLFEGVQVLDQIARQVEDPGLRGTSQTHVGLELSIRHAAEFFSFYVCRFVLADLGILIEKFVKRGTEWVLT